MCDFCKSQPRIFREAGLMVKASSIFSAASPWIAAQYGISTEVSLLGLSLFLLGPSLAPVSITADGTRIRYRSNTLRTRLGSVWSKDSDRSASLRLYLLFSGDRNCAKPSDYLRIQVSYDYGRTLTGNCGR